MSNVFHYFANNEPLESKQKRSSKLQTALTVSRFLMHRQFSRDTGGKGCDEDQALLANTISPKLKTQAQSDEIIFREKRSRRTSCQISRPKYRVRKIENRATNLHSLLGAVIFALIMISLVLMCIISLCVAKAQQGKGAQMYSPTGNVLFKYKYYMCM